MPNRILHVVDPSTPPDALEMLARLLRRRGGTGWEHRLAGMGHRITGKLAVQAGIETPITWVSSLGWGDPGGWRGLGRVIAGCSPSHVHAWGIAGVVATACSRISGKRIASFLDVPSRPQMRALRFVERRGSNTGHEWMWAAGSSSIGEALKDGGLSPDRVIEVRPAVRPAVGGMTSEATAKLRQELEIAKRDGPVILLGGEGRRARHDYGLWTAAILQQIYPRLRVIVRDDDRNARDQGLSRFLDALPNQEMLIVAPAERRCETLLHIADLLLVTPDGPIPTGSILAAMAAKVPVIGTPVPCVQELIADGRNGLLAKEVKPRSIAARVEAFLEDAALRLLLTGQAYADVEAEFSEEKMLAEFDRVYDGTVSPMTTIIERMST